MFWGGNLSIFDQGGYIDLYRQYIVGVRVDVDSQSKFYIIGVVGMYSCGEYRIYDWVDFIVWYVDGKF